MTETIMKLGDQVRHAEAGITSVDAASRTMTISFSSELPADQPFGREILSHAPGAADLTRLNSGAPLLYRHDKSDVRGVVENASIDPVAKRGVATVRFGRGVKAEELFNDVNDKIIRGVSVGYTIRGMKQTGGTSKRPEYTVTNWQPNEITITPFPADHTVGIGRESESVLADVTVILPEPAPAETVEREDKTMPTEAETAAAATAVVNTAREAAITAERERITVITALGAKFERGEMATKLINEGATLDVARSQFLEAIGAKQVPVGAARGASDIDLSEREKKSYSMCRAIMARLDNRWDTVKSFEREISDEIGKVSGRGTAGFFFPSSLPMDGNAAEAARAIVEGQRATSTTAYAATTGSQGGASLIQTTLMSGSFIDVLRAKARVMQAGATMLSGLVGNVAIPRQDTAATAYWLSPEGADITESEGTFDQITLTPRTIGVYSQMTRQMLMQSSVDIEMLVRNDMAAVMALGIDSAALYGTGASGQPTGILNRSGINTVAIGTNGGPSSIDNLIDLETAIMLANVDGSNVSYMTNAKVVGGWKKLKDTTGRYLWADNTLDGQWGQRGNSPMPGSINGYPVFRTNQVPMNLTKGSGTGLSAIIMANWSDLIIGEWGVMEIMPNAAGAGFKSGTIEVRALQSVDINVRHVASFSVITDATQ